MWVNRAAWEADRQRSQEWQARALLAEAREDSQNAAFRQLSEIRAFLENENRQLRERLIEAEAAARTGQAQAAIWAIRVNQLQSERDQLLARVVPGLDLRTPHVSPSGVGAVLESPGISFEHDPHGAAPPPDPIDVPRPGPLTPDPDGPELVGLAYDPFADLRDAAAADADPIL